MRVGILSDIHGNLEALECVLSACDERDLDEIYCLGDVVGYGADPGACLDLIRARGTVVCAGNHDWAASGLIDTEDFNRMAADAIAWTREQIDADQRHFLRALPTETRDGDVLFVHGSPHEPDAFHYIFTASEAASAIGATDARFVFVGHSHRAFAFSEDDGETVAIEGRHHVKDHERILVNVGSVGQPRDGDPRAAFCVWDRATNEIELCRVPYDVNVTQKKILDEGLPAFLAQRLSDGR